MVAPAESPPFPGFPDFRANVTFVPIQFFTVVVPTSSRGVIRIVGYALRRILGWVDRQGNPTRSELVLSYRELIEQAGVGRDSIGEALAEAVERRFLTCVTPPAPDSAAGAGRSGVYGLCWDEEGAFTHSPREFRGFYYPEAALIPAVEGGRTVERPKAARKNIPNAYFDYLLPREPLSVIRVVGALLFYSIQWGPGGERKEPVSKSISELSRLARLSRRHVHEAVHLAMDRGYIERIDPGRFDPAAGRESRSASYGIRWTRDDRPAEAGLPVGEGERESWVRSKKVHGGAVGNGIRNGSERVNGGESEKVNGIKVKRELNKETTAAAVGSMVSGLEAEGEAPRAFEALRQAGFDTSTAGDLAKRFPPEVIERQIAWIDLRPSKRSRLGMLRRAIEGDWAKPEGDGPADAEEPLAGVFASHYYAAYHGFQGEPATEAFGRDIEQTGRFLRRLLKIEANESKVPEWGRRFGRLVRGRHAGDPKARPNLSNALVLYGDLLLGALQREGRERGDADRVRTRTAHAETFASDYLDYLRREEERVRRDQPEAYEEFLKGRQASRARMTSGRFTAPAGWLARFDSEEARLRGFAEFFAKAPRHRVFGFWEWDERENPRGLGRQFAREVQA